jgi:hypothetical protein
MKIGIFLFAALPFFCLAGEKVVWSDADNYYAIGTANNKSPAQAKKDSCNSAKRELIEYVFGASYSSNRNILNSSGNIDYSQQFTINTEEVRLRGVFQVPEEVKSGEIQCTVTYPIVEAKIERERLESGSRSKNTKFTEIGNENDVRGGTFEIVTIPDDAEVYVDNKRWGTTPLRLYGKLSVGKHQIRIDKDNYEIIEQFFEIGEAKTTRIEKLLIPAMAKIRINTNIEGAIIKIDGEIKGKSPTEWIQIPSGQRFKITAEHNEAEQITQTYTLGRDEMKTEEINLKYKPGAVSVHVTNCANPKINLDSKRLIEDSQRVTLDAGSHELDIECKGFEEYRTSFRLAGGEEKILPSITLSREEKTLPSITLSREESISSPSQKWPSFGLIWEYSKCEVGLDCPVMYKIGFVETLNLSDSIALRIIATGERGGIDYGDGSLEVRGHQINLGIPFRIYHDFLLSPEVFKSNHIFTIVYKDPKNQNKEFINEVDGVGLSLSYLPNKNIIEWRTSAHKYEDSADFQSEIVYSFSLIWKVTL